jgi:CDP-diacylglycerol---serine O-phosphatidyltransferase
LDKPLSGGLLRFGLRYAPEMDEPMQPPAASDTPALKPRRKGIYVLPNAITLSALFSGFYAIVMAINGRYDVACMAIFCSAILDSLDGRVARMTNTQSAFGEQMDSLCDMVSFGAAPPLIMYVWALKDMGKLGWIAAFVYMSGAALRLARFNVNIGVVDKRFFQGLPSPAAAALVIGLVWVADDAGFKNVGRGDWMAWVAFAVTLFAGLSMVTNAPFYSFKVVGGRSTVPFAVIVAIALGIAVINLDPPKVLFALFCLYGLSGYAVYLWRKAKGRQTSVIATSTEEPDEIGLHR